MLQSRRQFSRSAGALIIVLPAGCIIAGDDEVEVNEAWEERAAMLESNGIFTADSEGKWEGKAGSHVPVVTMNASGSVSLSTEHPMDPDHYITTHYVRNQDGIVIALYEYEPGDSPQATFVLPPSTKEILAYQYCNLHDAWEDGPRPY